MQESDLKKIEGTYEVLEKLREGGMGAVYKVRHRILNQLRVIKIMRADLKQSSSLRDRFLHEAKTAIRLKHDNIARLYDCTVDDEGNAFMVMEFIDGESLEDVIAGGCLPPVPLALELARQALDALAYLHKRGIVHRDISPDNLMVARDEAGQPQLKLIDLGVAKVLRDGSRRTGAGVFVGKVAYAAPEQIRGDGTLSAMSDLYAFGVVLYELLTGVHPIAGDDQAAMIGGHLDLPPTAFAESDPNGRVGDELRLVVLRALGKDPVDRFQSAEELAARLAELTGPWTVADVEGWMAAAAAASGRVRRAGRLSSAQRRLNRQFGLKGGAAEAVRPGAGQRRRQSTVVVAITPEMVAGDDDRAPLAAGPEAAADEPAVAAPEVVVGGDEAAALAPPAAVAACLGRALEHIDEGRLRDALATLAEARAIDPDSPEVMRLTSFVTTALEEDGTEAAPASTSDAESEPVAAALVASDERALAAELARLDRLGDDGRFDEARAGLDVAEREHGASPGLVALRAALDDRRRRQDEEQELCRLARLDLTAHRFDDAVGKLEQALALGVNPDRVGDLLRAARLARDRRDEELQQARAVVRVIDEIDELIDGERFKEASERLDEAVRTLGDNEDFARLRAWIAEQRKVELAIARHAARTRELVDEERFDDAVEELALLVVINEGLPVVAELRAEIKRARNRSRAVATIRRALDGGDLNAARSLVSTARAEFGGSDSLDQLGRRIALVTAGEAIDAALAATDLEAARAALAAAAAELGADPALDQRWARLAELDQRRREERFALLVAEVEVDLDEERFAEATARLELARSLAVCPDELARWVAAVAERRELAARREARRRAVATAVETIGAHLAAGDLAAAGEALRAAAAELGADDELARLSECLAAAQAEIDRRLAVAAELTAEVRTLAAADELDRADERMLALTALGVAVAELGELTELVASGRRRVAHLAAFRSALAVEDEEAAAVELTVLVGEGLVDAEVATGLERELAALRRALLHARVGELVGEGRDALDAGDLERAVAAVNQALDFDGADARARELVTRIDEETRRRREERQRRELVDGEVEYADFLLAAGQLAEARSHLAAAIERFGPADPLVAMLERVDQGEAAQQQRRGRVRELLERAQELGRGDDLEGARAALLEARAVDASHPMVLALLEEVAAALVRQAEAPPAVASDDGHAAQGADDWATGERLLAASAELPAVQLMAVDGLFGYARCDGVEGAGSTAQEGSGDQPDELDLAATVAAAVVPSLAEIELVARLSEQLEAITAKVDGGGLRAAAVALDEVEERLGTFASPPDLRRSVHQLRQRLTAALGELDGQLAAATAALAVGDEDLAAAALEQAARLDPLDDALWQGLEAVGAMARERAAAADAALDRPRPESAIARPAPSGEAVLAVAPFTSVLRWAVAGIPLLDPAPADVAPDQPGLLLVPVALRCTRADEALALCLLDELLQGNRLPLAGGVAELATAVRFEPAGMVRLDLALRLVERTPGLPFSREEMIAVEQEVAKQVNQAYRLVRRRVAAGATLVASVAGDEVVLAAVPNVTRCLPCSWAALAPGVAPRWQREPCLRASGQLLVDSLERPALEAGLVVVEFLGTFFLFAVDLAQLARG